MKIESEIGVMWPQAKDTKEFLRPPEARRSQGFYPRANRGIPILHFLSLASRTTSDFFSLSSQPVVVIYYGSDGKLL